MRGRTPMAGKCSCWLLGLGYPTPRPQPPVVHERPAATIATDFDPAVAGAIEGRVTWDGRCPSCRPSDYRRNLPGSHPPEPRLVRENPNTPTIDAATRGVAGAVLFLRNVEARHAKPWDQPPVRVEHRDRRLLVMQGSPWSADGVRSPGPIRGDGLPAKRTSTACT